METRFILDLWGNVGFYVPYLKGASPTGACRVCIVEVENARTLPPSCSTPVARGMKVLTESPRVVKARRTIIELLLASGTHNCAAASPKDWTQFQADASDYEGRSDLCPAWGDCKLQDLAFRYQARTDRFAPFKTEYPMELSSPLIVRDYSRCIMCGRCVQACNEVQVNRAISHGYRGSKSKIVASGDRELMDSDCVFCGECVQACPVGALVEKKSLGKWRPWAVEKIRTTCPYCGVGCQQLLHVKDGRIVKVTGVEDGAPNYGRLCVKGRFGYDFIHSEERLTHPLIREGETFRKAGWDEALDLVAEKFGQIKEQYGPDALAGISCARSINEDSYNMQKLFRAVIGTNNIDHCARTCHAPTVAGLAKAFGSGAMTNSFKDISETKLFFVIGSNMTEAHPVAASYVKQAVRKGARLIVADPRRNGIAEHAHLDMQIKVGSDVALINAMMHVLITEDLYGREYVEAHTTGFEAMKKTALAYPPERAAEICGIDADTIRKAARETLRSNKTGADAVVPGDSRENIGQAASQLRVEGNWNRFINSDKRLMHCRIQRVA